MVAAPMTVERPPGDLGKKLREARERKGVSLRQIANSTKIAVAVLEGLERNDISKLPGGIFGRGFVRSFATEVGLDPETTIQEFIVQFRDDSVAVGHPPSEQIEDNEVLESKRRMARTFLGLIGLSIPVAAVITYFGFAGRHEPVVTTEGLTASVVTPARADPFETGDASAAGASAPHAGSDNPSPTPVAPNGRPGPDGPLVDRMVVKLAVTRACWISATVDGRKEMEQLLNPGDDRSLDVRNELALSVGDAGALIMTINGVEARPLGKSGEVVKARLNLANVKTYLPDR
jgi:cytoskeleton protein RodZ